jgi:hypothetical protein
MTDKLLEMVKEAGFLKRNGEYVGEIEELEAFANLIRADEKKKYEIVAWISNDENHLEWRKGALLELGYKEHEIHAVYIER